MTDQITKLNEKICCVNCGFFYGFTDVYVSGRDEAVFDPDVFRDEQFQVNRERNYPDKGIVISNNSIRTYNGGVGRYQFSNLKSIRCLHVIFAPEPIKVTDDRNAQNEGEKILRIIREDRSETCRDVFFRHHPGLSPKEHVERQLQERANAILISQENYWKSKENRDRKWSVYAAWFFGFTTLILGFANYLIRVMGAK